MYKIAGSQAEPRWINLRAKNLSLYWHAGWCDMCMCARYRAAVPGKLEVADTGTNEKDFPLLQRSALITAKHRLALPVL